MAEKVELELKLKGGDKAVKTLGKLEQELNDAREAIKKVEVGSKAFETLAQKIQKTGSEIKVLEKNMESLEPQQKAEAFLKLGEGIAGGFAVGQGAMALMGVESENLEKLQVKVQSAIAIAQGVRMMSEAALMATTAKRVIVEKFAIVQSKIGIVVSKAQAIGLGLWATAQGVLSGAIGASSIALGVLKVAIMMTGIGALVIGVVALVGAMSSWFSSSKDNEGAQRDLAKESQAVAESIKNQLTASRDLADHNRAVAKEDDVRKKKLLELQEALKQQVIQTNTYNDALSALRASEAVVGQEESKNTKKFREKKEAMELLEEGIKDQIDAQNDLIKTEDKAAKNTEDNNKTSSDNSRKATEQRIAEAKELFNLTQELALMRIEDDDLREAAKIEQDRQKALIRILGSENEAAQKLLINDKYDLLEAERKQKVADKEYDAFIEQSNKFNEANEANAEKEKEIAQKVADKKMELDQIVEDTKANMIGQGFELARTLGGKNEKIQKGIAVTETIFSTQKAVMRALADIPAPWGVPQAILHGAMGVAAVGNILSESMDGVPDTTNTPDTMTPSTTGAFTLGGGLPDQDPIKTYVITDEMSDSQAQLSDIRRRSTI